MNNKWIKKKMIKKYGEECMIEDANIRYMPDVLDENRQGRSEADNKLTYHHIVPVKEGGKATEENGALIKWYNHKWLESLPKEERDKINKELQEYKAFIRLKKAREEERQCQIALAGLRNGKIKGHVLEIDMSDCIEIPLEQEKEKEERER